MYKQGSDAGAATIRRYLMKRHLVGVAAAVLGTILISGAGLYSAAVAAPATTTTVTLPLFGVPLTLDIATDPGGAITNVAVTPATNTVATKLKPHKVVFQSADPANPTADPARLVVKSGHGGQSVTARAGSLAAVSGPGVWKGDVFGTGVLTTVTFTVGHLTDGSADITGVATGDPTAVVGATDHSSGDGEEGDSGSSARVSIKFTNAAGDQSRSLKISVRVHDGEEGKTSAKLSISLGRIRGVAVAAVTAVGTHTWTGSLCTGPATITYTVDPDGSISAASATPATAVVEFDGGKINVKFSDTESIRISVRMDDGGMFRTNVSEHLRCNSADPTTNTPISIPVDNGHHGGGDHHGGGGHKGGSDG
jgi:hypothetical protein